MTPRRITLPSFLVHNKGAKLGALFLALVTWYGIQSVISYEAVISDVPLTIHLDDGWAILDRSARTVDVVFRGSQEDMRYLGQDQVKMDIDLRGQTFEGSQTIRLRPQYVHAPGAVRPILIRPDELTLRLDREAEKQIPIKADLQGTPPEGYEVERVVCTPASVTLIGPRQRLGEIESLRTAPIDLEGRSRSFKKLKIGVMQPSETWVAQMAPSNVAVEITIAERAATKEVEDVSVSVVVPSGARNRVDLRPNKVVVTVKGRAELLKTLTVADVMAFVYALELEPAASYDLPVRVQLPSGLSVVGVEPPTVNVTRGDL